MTILLATVGVSFAAFVVWLTVRIVNRRERWAMRVAWALLAISPILYVLSIGPAFLVYNHMDRPLWYAQMLTIVYTPVIRSLRILPTWASDLLLRYINWGLNHW